jgi:hypothetical protein
MGVMLWWIVVLRLRLARIRRRLHKPFSSSSTHGTTDFMIYLCTLATTLPFALARAIYVFFITCSSLLTCGNFSPNTYYQRIHILILEGTEGKYSTAMIMKFNANICVEVKYVGTVG